MQVHKLVTEGLNNTCEEYVPVTESYPRQTLANCWRLSSLRPVA